MLTAFAMPTLVHLVYIHGFQGNDTTFQSFPKHLQEHLNATIPPHLDVTIQSSLYPTYKSVKPISHATKNFLEWLSTQPPGPVILLGHSMGGLLAAEAATDPSNSSSGRPKRIVGVVSFDTPFLGMHPHVVITGISSLLPKGDGEDGQKTERKMNQHPQVQIVDQSVTDDWEAFKKQAHVHLPKDITRYTSSSSSSTSYLSSSPSASTHTRSRSPSPSGQLMDRAVAFLSAHTDEPVARWLRKHADDPLSAAKRWVVERLQFGICMFDPAGLKARYSHLVAWEAQGGLWVNYWTHTVGRAGDVSPGEERRENDAALRVNGVLPASPAETPAFSLLPLPTTQAEAGDGASTPKKKKVKGGRHFVVLPNGLGQVLGGMEKWEKVPIAGVDDEVNAHTGLFIPHQNLEYDALVRRVAERVLNWSERLPQVERRN